MWEKQKHDMENLNFYKKTKNDLRVTTTFCRNKKIIYGTPLKLCEPITIKNIFNYTEPFLNELIEKYKDRKIYNAVPTYSIYRVIIYFSKFSIPVDFKNGKLLREIEFDKDNKIVYEKTNVDDDKDLILSFFIDIEIELFNENKFFQYDGIKYPLIKNKCVLCKRNKPNVLITKCFCLVVCDACLRFNSLSCCPFCLRSFSEAHKVVFSIERN